MEKFKEFNFSIEDTIADFEFVSVDVILNSSNGESIPNGWGDLIYKQGIDTALDTVYEFIREDGKGSVVVIARNRIQQELLDAYNDVLNAENEKEIIAKASYLLSNFYHYQLFALLFLEDSEEQLLINKIRGLDDSLIEKDFFLNTIKEILNKVDEYDPTKLPTYDVPFVDKKKSEQVFDILDEVEAELEKEAD